MTEQKSARQDTWRRHSRLAPLYFDTGITTNSSHLLHVFQILGTRRNNKAKPMPAVSHALTKEKEWHGALEGSEEIIAFPVAIPDLTPVDAQVTV